MASKAPIKQLNNRPQSAIKQTRNKAASFSVKQSASGVSTAQIKKATKNPAPAPKAGGFKSFISGK